MVKLSIKSNKSKGLLMILVLPLVIISILFLRVMVTFFTNVNGSEGVAPKIVTSLLDFVLLICVIGAIVLIPVGIVFLCKKGSEESDTFNGAILAGRGNRWLAKFVDSLLFVPAFLGSFIVMWASGETSDTGLSASIFWLIFLSIAGIQAYYLTTQGQTIAKKWLKIRIVDAESRKVGGFIKNVLLRSVLNFVFSFVPFYGLVDVLFIFREDRRCVHDLLAGTMVVNAGNDFAESNILVPKSAAKFCTHCGTKAKPSAKFCVSCGTTLH